MDISIEKPPPKPPHNNLEKKNIPEASPMTDLANNFRSLSSSTSTIKVENDTPSRMKLLRRFEKCKNPEACLFL